MSRTRIAAVAAAALLFVAAAITAAAAQTATSQPAGKPLQLLQIVEQPSKAKPHVKAVAKSAVKRSSKVAARTKKHTHLAALRRHRPQLPVQAAAATPAPTPAPVPDSILPAANPAMTTEIAGEPAVQPAPAVPGPHEVVVAGQTVKLAPPDEVNEIDLAANDAAPQTSDAAPVRIIAGTPPLSETSDSTPKSDSMRAFAVAQPQQPNEVGSTSWILQVLAALGGAITAGTVAWFLIGGTPQRTYG